MSLKNLTNAEYYAHIEAHGHVLRREEDGRIDQFALDYEHHNGPRCVRVGCCESWCQHCRDEVEQCLGAMGELFPLKPSDAIASGAEQ